MICEEDLSDYIREDLQALEDDLRQDKASIMQDLRFLFRSYGQKYKRKEDWVPLPSVEGRADAPAGALNINGGN